VPREQGLGDCIDCSICVQVCPTGIDIRDGLQMECIGCAACIDACDQVMDKMNYPRGLIRYSTENAVKEHFTQAEIVRRARRPRVLVYGAVFFVLTAATAWSLATRVPLKVDILRDRVALAREVEDGAIENVFRVQLTNASERDRRYLIEAEGLPGIRVAAGGEVAVPAASTGAVTVQVQAEPGGAGRSARVIRLHVRDADDPAVAVTEETRFWME
jgi:cytochrome c oxidase accessory protein FixG